MSETLNSAHVREWRRDDGTRATCSCCAALLPAPRLGRCGGQGMSGEVEVLTEVEYDDLCICSAAGKCRTPRCDENRAIAADTVATHVKRAVAEALAPVLALADEFPDCWVTKGGMRCTEFIGATFPNGAAWVEPQCCLPCRLRAAAGTPTHDATEEETP